MWIHLMGCVSVNETEDILGEHLAKVAELLRHRGMKDIAYYEHREIGVAYLHFSGAFCVSVLSRLSVVPELPQGKPITVECLGGFRFKIRNR